MVVYHNALPCSLTPLMQGQGLHAAVCQAWRLRSFLSCSVIALTGITPNSMLEQMKESLQLTNPLHVSQSISFPLDRPTIFMYSAQYFSIHVMTLGWCLTFHVDLRTCVLMNGLQPESDPPKSIIYVQQRLGSLKL